MFSIRTGHLYEETDHLSSGLVESSYYHHPDGAQGARTDHIYFVESGEVSLTRQIDIKRHNRWPMDATHWEYVQTMTAKSFVVDAVSSNDCFGDEAVLGNIIVSLSVGV